MNKTNIQNKKCNYCSKNDDVEFNSVCIACNEGIKEACLDCFQKWSHKHPIRPYNISVNRWNGGTHLIDVFTKEGFTQRVNKYNSKIREVI